jgi:general stress protein 26
MQISIERDALYPGRHRSRFCNVRGVEAASLLTQAVCCVLLFGALTNPRLVLAAQTQKKWSRDELISAAREVMNTARYCALITTDGKGSVQARTMDAFAPDENMIVWLATNPRSRKVGEIRRNPRVTLYYFDRENQAYVTIHGTARLVNNTDEKSRHWKEQWSAFYPNRNKDYLLIKVVPTRLEIVDTKKGMVGDAKNWRPPTVLFSKSN